MKALDGAIIHVSLEWSEHIQAAIMLIQNMEPGKPAEQRTELRTGECIVWVGGQIYNS